MGREHSEDAGDGEFEQFHEELEEEAEDLRDALTDGFAATQDD